MSEQTSSSPEQPHNPQSPLPDDALNIQDEEATHQLDPDTSLKEGAGTTSLKAIEDLTLAELLGVFFRQPRQTAAAVRDILQAEPNTSSRMLPVTSDEPESTSETKGHSASYIIRNIITDSPIFGYSLAFICVFIGNTILLGGDASVRRTADVQLANGVPFLIAGFCIWLLTELYFAVPDITAWWHNRSQQSENLTSQPAETPQSSPGEVSTSFFDRFQRGWLAGAGLIFSIFVWFGAADNSFSLLTFVIWLVSIACWALALSPRDANILRWIASLPPTLHRIHWRKYVGVLIALMLIMGVALQFRFHRLDQHPREMTDDHVEKILDAGLVRDGARNIFFANNGGREPLQMYLIAMASHLPGLGINFFTIKFVSATESLLTIPILFWMGYALLEGESQRRRLLVGVMLAGLVAVSYWHVAITRQGLRIPLTPLVVALHLIYLMRGIRHNRRTDFVIAGLILGVGLYTYQAVRMLPVVIVVAVCIAIIFNAKSFKQQVQYALNLMVLVVMSFIVFLPMFRYSVDFPELFWRRTTGRLLGDDVIQEQLPSGEILYRDATTQERVDAFLDNVPTIASNVRNVLLMFNWEGDVATISGVSNHPTMDTISGTLLIVGLAAWLAFAIRRRDTVYWLVPLIALLMLLPSALSIAFPQENPSHTRTSGAIPLIYLMTAFPLALFVEKLLDQSNNRLGKLAAGGLSIMLIFGSYNANAYLYFQVYPARYEAAFSPYSDAGQYLYGYVLSGGAYGNAYLIGAEHWWSHRAIGLEAGLDEFWPGGIWPYQEGQYSTAPIISTIYAALDTQGTFQFRPNADLIFFYSPNDENTAAALAELFPTGTAYERTTYKPNETFMVYEIPALGAEGLQDWLAAHPAPE